mgnify:CR=1 FL=1
MGAWRALARGDGERAHLAALDVLDRARQVVEEHLHLPTDQIGQRTALRVGPLVAPDERRTDHVALRARQGVLPGLPSGVGQPRDGDNRAMYALFDSVQAHLTFFRVPYDFHAAAAAIRHSGQPEYFARRLEHGL